MSTSSESTLSDTFKASLEDRQISSDSSTDSKSSYYNRNRTVVLSNSNAYYAKNRDKVLSKLRGQVNCETCNKSVTQTNYKAHCQSKTHIELATGVKRAPRVQIDCDCGTKVPTTCMAKHVLSKVHLNRMAIFASE